MQNGMTYIVRPRMQPRYSSVMVAFISAGAIQLLVGPASASSTEQMKVRSSTRATSPGSVRAQNELGFFSGIEPDQRAGVDQRVGEAGPLVVGAVAPDDPVGGGQCGDLVDPGQQAGVRGWGLRHGDLLRSALTNDQIGPASPAVVMGVTSA